MGVGEVELQTHSFCSMQDLWEGVTYHIFTERFYGQFLVWKAVTGKLPKPWNSGIQAMRCAFFWEVKGSSERFVY